MARRPWGVVRILESCPFDELFSFYHLRSNLSGGAKPQGAARNKFSGASGMTCDYWRQL
jgi:hypothetical protein